MAATAPQVLKKFSSLRSAVVFLLYFSPVKCDNKPKKQQGSSHEMAHSWWLHKRQPPKPYLRAIRQGFKELDTENMMVPLPALS